MSINFITNKAAEAAKEKALSLMPVFTGYGVLTPIKAKLNVVPQEGQHITWQYKPSEEAWLAFLFEAPKKLYFQAIGYQNDSLNEGLEFKLNNGIKIPFGGNKIHMTLSYDKSSKPVYTGELEFLPIEDGHHKWMNRLHNGETIQFNNQNWPKLGFDFEARAYYGYGQYKNIGEIREEIEKEVLSEFPEELEARQIIEEQKTLQRAAEDKIRHLTYELQAAERAAKEEKEKTEQLLKEYATPEIIKEAAASMKSYLKEEIPWEYDYLCDIVEMGYHKVNNHKVEIIIVGNNEYDLYEYNENDRKINYIKGYDEYPDMTNFMLLN